VGLLALLSLAAAQGNLYGPGTPDNASYIRVVHAAADAPEATALIGGGLSGESLAYGEVSDYALVLSGETPVVVEVGDEALELTVEVAPLSFYTVALVGSTESPELRLIEDEVSDNLARTLLALYNFTEATLALRTADGETEIVAGVGPIAADGVMVNPVTVSLGVFEGEELRYTLTEVRLEAGEAYSVVVFGPPEEGAVSLVRAAGGD
jgi:alginate O-acetyltransferase complex protein AlgF